jgi:hypothetical protein
MQHLGNEGYLLHGEVVYALSDDNTSVIEGIMPNLADMLKVFVQAKLISPDTMASYPFMVYILSLFKIVFK